MNGDGSFNKDEFDKVESKLRQGIETKLDKAKEEAATEARKEAEGKGTFDDGFKKGEAKAYTKQEKALREKFGIEDKLSGEDLLNEIAASKDKASKDITKDQVERLPWFQELMEQRDKAHKDELKKVKDEFDGHKAQVSKKERMDAMWKKALPVIEELNLNFSPDPQRKAAQLERMRRDLEANDYDVQDDRILVLKDGKVIKDKLDNTVPFADHVTSTVTSWLDPKESKDRSSAGAKNDDGKGGKSKGWTKEMPKNDEQYQAYLLDESIPIEERSALRDAYKNKE
ncbi:MAG: hypothetical protein KDC00_15065 [Flavobacteriales bacterium]|nr:hypothetical protein [Flavobacteriales bacterium]